MANNKEVTRDTSAPSAAYLAYSNALDSLLQRRLKTPTLRISLRSVARKAKRNHVSLSCESEFKALREKIAEIKRNGLVSPVTASQRVIQINGEIRKLIFERDLFATKYQDALQRLAERDSISRDTPKDTSWGRGQSIPPVAAS
jgi:hypothetical protein